MSPFRSQLAPGDSHVRLSNSACVSALHLNAFSPSSVECWRVGCIISLRGFVRCLWVVCEVFWGFREVFVRCLWDVCEVFVRCLWSLNCGVFTRCLWGVCEVFTRCLWGVCEVFCEVFARCLWSVCIVLACEVLWGALRCLRWFCHLCVRGWATIHYNNTSIVHITLVKVL